MFRGGVPKVAAMRAKSKYGDDAITTADRAPQPEKTYHHFLNQVPLMLHQ